MIVLIPAAGEDDNYWLEVREPIPGITGSYQVRGVAIRGGGTATLERAQALAEHLGVGILTEPSDAGPGTQ